MKKERLVTDATDLLERAKNLYHEQVFHPRWWSILINSFYISRRGLSHSIKKQAEHISGTMLDFGCGSKPYLKLFSVEKCIGVDIKESGHDHKNSLVDVYYDGYTLPFRDCYFDSIFSAEVFEHVINLDRIFDELHRVLKKKGRILITVPFCWDQHEVPYDFARYTEFGLTHLLEQHGFKVLTHDKSASYIETITQLVGIYIYKNLSPENRIGSKLLHISVIAPLFVAGLLLNKVFPNNGNLYLDNIVLAEKY